MTPQTNPTTCLAITDSYACLLITAGFNVTPRGGVTLVVFCVLVAAGVVVVALLPSQSRGLIRTLVGGLIAIGRDPTGLRAVPCGTITPTRTKGDNWFRVHFTLSL